MFYILCLEVLAMTSTPVPTSTYVFSHSVVSQLFEALWTVACQAPLFMEFPRQEYWGWFPFPSPGDFPDTGVEPTSPVSPALQESLLLSYQEKPIL